MEAFGYSIKLQSRDSDVDWRFSGKSYCGLVLKYTATRGGLQLTIGLRTDEASGLIEVGLLGADPTNDALEELRGRQTCTWHRCLGDPALVYHTLHFALPKGSAKTKESVRSVEETRLHSPEFSEWCEHLGVSVLPYWRVRETVSPSHRDRLCAVLSATDRDTMVGLFLGEKVVPVAP